MNTSQAIQEKQLQGCHYEYEWYHSHVIADLEKIHGYDEWDFYTFVLLTDSHVSINAELMYSTFAFDFGITTYTSTDTTNPRDITSRYNYFIYTDDSYNATKSFSGLLTAGTYFIEIYRKSDCPTSNKVEYYLSVDVQKDNNKRNKISIPDLKFNKQLPAAIWLSDFQPTGYNFDPTLQKTYFHQNTSHKNEFEYALDDLRRYTENGEPVHAASIFVWDEKVKEVFHEIFYKLSEELISRLNEEEELRTEVTLIFDTVTNVWKLVGTIIKVAGLVVFPVNIILSTIDMFVIPFAEFLINEFLPKLQLKKYFYLSYLQRYIGALEDHDSGSVVELPLYYEFGKTTPFLGHPSYYVSFYPTVDKVISSPSVLYTSDYIYSSPNTSLYSKGRIYGFTTTTLSNFNNLVLAEDYSNIMPIETKVYLTSQTYPRKFLENGEFQWYSFTSPQTQEYYFLAQGSHNINVDVFNNIVDGYSNNGLLRTHTTKYTSPNDENNIGNVFSEFIEEGKTVFFRVKGKDYHSTETDYHKKQSTINFNVYDEQVVNAYSGTIYVINPEDYGFQPQYFFTTTVKNIQMGNYTMTTSRYRTGYIEEEFINLSPRRKNAGFAFLEYAFTDPVLKIEVNLSFWGAYEYINNTNATAVIEYKDENGNWVTMLDLLNDVNLSTDRNNQDTYTIYFPGNGVRRFRYYMTSEAVGDQNRGRISIGTTRIYIDKD